MTKNLPLLIECSYTLIIALAEGIIKNILVAQHKIQMIRVMIYWNNFLNWVGTGVVNSMGSPVMGW